MNDKPVKLYLVSGITGLVGGILMIVAACMVMFQLQDAYVGAAKEKMEFIAGMPLVGITHGLSFVSLLLITPAVVALFVLLRSVATARTFLGLTFALFWIVIEMIGHLSHTAPLRTLTELYSVEETRQIAIAIYSVSDELWEALSRAAGFVAVLMFICYGLVFVAARNVLLSILILLACIAFPVGMVWQNIGIQPHVILRGLALIIISGVLIKAVVTEED